MNNRMGFYHKITLALALICLLGECGQGASVKGRYMWVKCHPDDKDANCLTMKGPWVSLKGQNTRLPPSAAKHIVPVSTEEATPDIEEQSGEGSGNSGTEDSWMGDGPEQEVKNEEEASTWMEGSGDVDYAEYVSPQKIDRLSSQDLKEDNIIA